MALAPYSMNRTNFALCIWLFLVLIGCREEAAPSNEITRLNRYENKVELPKLARLLSDRSLHGSVMMYNETADSLYSNDFTWREEGVLPASTFKIPNTAIGLEMGILANRNSVFRWDGIERSVANWNQDLSVEDAYAYSCVPCYQWLAREAGPERINTFLDSLEYSSFTVSPDSVDIFWLRGSASINQLEQIEFLRKLNHREFSLASHTYNELKAIMKMDSFPEYALYGKTGWSNDQGYNNGWFVGYLISSGETIYFATNLEPPAGAFSDAIGQSAFLRARIDLTLTGLRMLGWIEE